jgi:hypothetical protein
MEVIISKEKYNHLYNEVKETCSPFVAPSWLDTTSTHWDAIVAIKDGTIISGLAFSIKNKLGLTGLTMSSATPYFHFIHHHSVTSSEQNAAIHAIINNLPKFNYVNFIIEDTIDALPWQWSGFKTSNRVTCIIYNQPYAEVYSKYNSNLHGHIKAASKNLIIKLDDHPDNLINCMQATFNKQGLNLPISKEKIQKLHQANKKISHIFSAYDQDGKVHGSTMTIENNHTRYNLFSGRKQDAARGANALIHDHIIKNTMDLGLNYDFEGGNIEAIGLFFKSFGAEEAKMTRVYKVSNKFLEFYLHVKRRFD